MTEPDLLNWAITTGGPLAALTVVMFMFQRRDAQKHIDDLKEFHDKWKGQSEMLYTVVKDNTAAITELKAIIETTVRTRP